jgi:hypothetical protein
MTYGCLLRPHREIRELTWRDFTEDLAYIKRSGLRNKSGRNRISAISTFFIFWLEQAAQLKTNKYLKQKTPTKLMRVSCDRDRIRTCDRLLRRQMLYPAELRDQCTAKKKLHVSRKDSFLKPIELHLMSGWQDSNLRPPAPKAGAITGLRYTP